MRLSNSMYKVFLSILETKSITKTAIQLGYTQPNISHILSSIEDSVGEELFFRTKKGVFPTATALQIQECVQKIVEAEEELAKQVGRIHEIEVGQLRIGCYLSISVRWLPKIVSKFSSRYPHVAITFLIGTNQELCQWLIDGKLDFCLFSDPFPENFEFRFIKKDPLLAILPISNPLCRQLQIDLKELSKYPFIIPYNESDGKILGIMKKEQLPINVGYVTKGGCPSLALINQGLGVTLTHNLSYLVDAASFRKITSRAIIQDYSRNLGVCCKSFASLSNIENEFIEIANEIALEEDNE